LNRIKKKEGLFKAMNEADAGRDRATGHAEEEEAKAVSEVEEEFYYCRAVVERSSGDEQGV
jgi:hypothetical protein